jgi:hypothetical protein
MIPRIDLTEWKEDTVPKKEVEKMTEALSEAFAMILKQKESEYRFAKFISYLSLSVALVILFMEVFK